MEIRYGYGGTVLKTKGDAYFGIHKDVVKKFMGKSDQDDKWRMYLVFDIKNCFLNFATSKECSTGEEPKFKKMDPIMKNLIANDASTPVKGGYLYLKPFYIRMSMGAMNMFRTKEGSEQVFWAHGKVNKSFASISKMTKHYEDKNYSDDDDSSMKDAVKKTGVKNFKDIRGVLGSKTVWCLCPTRLRSRTLAVTNKEDLVNLTLEEQKKCRSYVSLDKRELFPIHEIPFMEECIGIYKEGDKEWKN